MGKIILENINLFGFHGCMKEEAKVGSLFKIDLEINLNLEKASITDELSDTIDYTYLYKIIKKEMFIRSNLIENLAQRIINSINKNYKQINHIKIKICKISPPLEGDVDMICVVLEK